MTFDPTTNRIPFKLLTSEEQEVLKAWPPGVEYFRYRSNTWESCSPVWDRIVVYRGKPEPKVTSYWFHVYEGPKLGGIWNSKEAANFCAKDDSVLIRIDICHGKMIVTKETNL